MSTPSDRRMRKRLATREAISDAATRLFIERGFDRVTVDEIAAAADVGRMTVFNHFLRKEDMFFDRDEEGREIVREALRQRDPEVSPVDALRLLVHRLVAERSPAVEFSSRSQRFVEAVGQSETLKARARAIRDELAQIVATGMAESAGQAVDDPEAQLAGSLVLATWAAAFLEAHRVFRGSQNRKKAEAMLLHLIDRGTQGLKAALAGSAYV